jgi:predicted transcriptional regulator
MKSSESNSIEQQIINLLARDNNLYVGDIVKELSRNALQVTNQIIKLKKSGVIKNMQGSARLTLAGNG